MADGAVDTITSVAQRLARAIPGRQRTHASSVHHWLGGRQRAVAPGGDHIRHLLAQCSELVERAVPQGRGRRRLLLHLLLPLESRQLLRERLRRLLCPLRPLLPPIARLVHRLAQPQCIQPVTCLCDCGLYLALAALAQNEHSGGCRAGSHRQRNRRHIPPAEASRAHLIAGEAFAGILRQHLNHHSFQLFVIHTGLIALVAFVIFRVFIRGARRASPFAGGVPHLPGSGGRCFGCLGFAHLPCRIGFGSFGVCVHGVCVGHIVHVGVVCTTRSRCIHARAPLLHHRVCFASALCLQSVCNVVALSSSAPLICDTPAYAVPTIPAIACSMPECGNRANQDNARSAVSDTSDTSDTSGVPDEA